MRYIKAGIIPVILVVLVAGCATCPKSRVRFQDQYIVGGGFSIEYLAHEPGRAILVDVASGRTLMTESLEAGRKFESIIDPGDPEAAEMLSSLGVDLAKANLVLYFIPDSAPARPDEPE